jgi:cytosine/adenosine deaminase-related metal-dependent hydrolase
MVGLHASFTVSDETIKNAAGLARHLGVGLHVHVAEDLADVDDAKKRGYHGLIDRLADNNALVAGSIFAHGVHLSAAEVQRCWDAGVWLVQNPRSNKGNKVGYPVNLVASDRVALGTDGYPADMEAEIAALKAEAEANGDDMEAVDKRPKAGIRLLTELFGEVPEASPPPAADQLEAIRARARQQAELLWKRMKAI